MKLFDKVNAKSFINKIINNTSPVTVTFIYIQKITVLKIYQEANRLKNINTLLKFMHNCASNNELDLA